MTKIQDRLLLDLLVEHGVVQEAAVEDPDNYDGAQILTGALQVATELRKAVEERNHLHDEFSPANVVKMLNEVKDCDDEESHMLCCLLNCLLYLGQQDVVEAYHEASLREDPDCKNVFRRKYRIRYEDGGPLATEEDKDTAIVKATALAAEKKDATFLVTRATEVVIDSINWDELEEIKALEADDDE